MSVFIDSKNYFNEQSFNEICEALEHGKTTLVGIDSIGYTRNNNEQEAYKEALLEKYGDKLKFKCNRGALSYSYEYKLKDGGTE